MKRYLVLAVFVLFLAGCATSNTVSENPSSEPVPVTVQNLPPPAANQPVKRTATKTTRKTTTARSSKTKGNDEVKPGPYSLELKVSDQEDDITKLLTTNYNQNFDIPIVFNDAVKYYIKWFSEDRKKVFANWLKRSRLYVPIITEILRENDMPEDLVYLAMIESGFNPKAYSRAKASGPWQFIYSTGGRYGLEVDYWVDERRDPEKSTVAAAKYLRTLFNQFGCWYLAAASYNAGEGRIGRLLQKHNTNDYWELHKYNTLPKETREYIPQLIAAAIIAKDPARFGFGNITYDPPVRFAEVKVPAATPITAIAKASSTDVDTIRMYNPEVLRGITPPGTNNYAIKLPAGTDASAFKERLEAELETVPTVKSITTYKVRKKDSLAKILKKYNVSQQDLALVNTSDNDLRIKPGMVIAIPAFSGDPTSRIALAKSMPEAEPVTTVRAKPARDDGDKPKLASLKKSTASTSGDADRETRPVKSTPSSRTTKTFHVVKKGETLAQISDRYGIDEDSLRSANKIKGNRVYPNMKIRLVSHAEPKKTASSSHAKKVKYHTVKKGETLSSIAEKYGVDVDDIKSANKLKGNKITKNARLKIVKES